MIFIFQEEQLCLKQLRIKKMQVGKGKKNTYLKAEF